MCRWTALVIYIVLCQQLIAQPIADINIDRSTRQLDFGECCPCNNNDDTIEGYDGLYDVMGADSESAYPQPRDFNDCPCRDSDSQGASSVFFPNTLRTAGNFLRSVEKKEDLKPIFNPEVDLATSVLETLREVTDEEYQDALERDAAKSAAKEDFTFGDTTPEESANILAVVVQPKFAASDEDIVPEVLHSQKSRCIHSIDSLTSVGEMPVLSESTFKIHKPLKMRHFLSHRNFNDADNGVGASSFHEQIVPGNVDVNSLEFNPSYLETVTTELSLSSISSTDKYCNVGQFPSFRSVRIRNNLKNFTRPNLLQSIRETSNSLSNIPTTKPKNWLPEKSENNNADLNSAASENELVETKLANFGNKHDRQNAKENNGPLSLKNLRKLKDVELIPLKELLNKQSKGAKNKKPKLLLPYILSRGVPKYDVAENDSNINYNKDSDSVNSDTDCVDERIIEKENNKDSIEQKSSSNNLETETIDLSTTLDKKPNDKPIIYTDNDWIGTENDALEDSLTGASNNFNDIVEKPTTFVNNIEQHLKNVQKVPNILNQKELSQHSTEVFDTNRKIKLFKPISIDKALSSIRVNIDRNIENLKNMRTSMQNKNIGDTIKVPILGSIKQEAECDNELDPEKQTNEINEVSTTLKPNLPNDNLIGNEILQELESRTLGSNLADVPEYVPGTGVTVKDLEKLSNSLLQQEEESVVSENVDQNRFEEIKDDIDSDMTLDQPKHPQFERVVEPTNIDNFIENNTCDTAVLSSRSDRLDDSFEVTTVSINIASNEDDNIGLQPSSIDLTYLPTINPLPALDKLFYKMASDITIMSSELSDNEKDENVMDSSEIQTNDFSINAIEADTKDKVEIANKFMPKNNESDNISNIQQPKLGFLKKPLPNINVMFNAAPQKTLLEDIKMKLNNLFDNSEMKTNEKINSDNAYMDTIERSEKCDDFSGKHVEEGNFESEVVTPSAPLLTRFDADFEARDMEKNNRAENNYNGDFNIQPAFQPQDSNLRESSTYINDLLNTITPNVIPTLNDFKLSNLLNNKNRKINISEKVATEEQKISHYRSYKNSEDDNCKSSKSSETTNRDSDVGASETILDIVPKNDEILGLTSILQPPLNFINKLNSFPLESLVKQSNLLDKHDRNKEINPLESSVPKLKSDLLNPVMATDASKSSFQTRIPSWSFLDNSNLWELNPLKSARKSNLLKGLKSKTLNDELLGIPLIPENLGTINEKSKFRSNQYSPSILRFPLDMEQSLKNHGEIFNSPRVKTKGKHAFNYLFRNTENPLEYTLQQIPKNNLKPLKNQLTGSSNILGRIAKNHEDFNDKIRYLHTDFNDRMKSVRNDILDRSKSPIKVKSPITEDLFRSSNNLRNQNKLKETYMKPALKERESTKFTSSLKSTAPKPIKRISLPKLESKKFRMPTAASNLVPKTVQVPELIPTSKKPISPPLRKESKSSLWNLPYLKQRSESPKLQTSNLKDLQKQFNSRKKATVKVSFSSTPRPSISSEDNGRFNVYNNLYPNELSTSNIGDTMRNAAPLKITSGETNSTGSWPKASDTSFLSKVKDAVQSKLSMVAPTNLKQYNIKADDTKTLKNSALSTDMSQAASEHKNINDMALKENVSYKCKMVCTRE